MLFRSQDGDKTHYIPGVPAFLREVDLENGQVTFCTIEGLLADDDN